MSTVRKIITFTIYYLYSVVSCLFLFSIGFFWGKNRRLIYQISSHFGPFDSDPNKPTPLIPKVPLSQIALGVKQINILEPEAVNGNITPLELIIINGLIRHYDPRRIFEIGTFDGRTTLNMAANSGEDAKVYTLDLPKAELHATGLDIVPWEDLYINKEAPGARYKGTEYREKITQLHGDSARFDFAPFVNQMDFVFVDGSHSYAYVLNDSKQAVRLLRNKHGVIVWHDYDAWEGVTNGLNKLHKENADFKRLKAISGTSLVCLLLD
jgi:SAM-dependent methyltransferase